MPAFVVTAHFSRLHSSDEGEDDDDNDDDDNDDDDDVDEDEGPATASRFLLIKWWSGQKLATY